MDDIQTFAADCCRGAVRCRLNDDKQRPTRWFRGMSTHVLEGTVEDMRGRGEEVG